MKLLILEADMKMDEVLRVTKYGKDMKKDGHEVKYIYNAYNSGADIVKLINWADALAFHTTFYYLHSIYQLAQGIAKHRKEPIDILIESYEHDRHIEDMVALAGSKYDSKKEEFYTDEAEIDAFAHSIQHMKLFQLKRHGDHIPITVLDARIKRHQHKLDTIAEYMASRHLESAKTGRFVKIKNLKSFVSKEIVNLKEGLIVPEICMDAMDPMPSRGTWVMGLTEPVKLLNEANYDEFEYVLRNLNDLAEEFVRKCGAELNTYNYSAVYGVLAHDDESINERANLICEALGVEKRHNRSAMRQRMYELNEQFKFEERVAA